MWAPILINIDLAALTHSKQLDAVYFKTLATSFRDVVSEA